MTGGPAGGVAVAAMVILTLAAPPARAGLTMDQAVTVAFQRNRDVIAARLEIDAAQLDVVAARIYPNPQVQYAAGNLVLGAANPQGTTPPVTSGFIGQPVQSIGVSELLDVWAKRSARARAASEGVERRRLLTEDALREIAYAVRSAFDDVIREQSENDLAHEVAGRYGETVRLSRARYQAGDISEADLRTIELEGLRYQNDVIDADTQLDIARVRLAGLMGLRSAAELGPDRLVETSYAGENAAGASPGQGGPSAQARPAAPPSPRPTFDVVKLTAQALEHRPDLRAAGAARVLAEAELSAAQREIYPDLTLGAAYTHSEFTVSGDNPDTLAFSLSLPLPLFDRNQANVGRARLDIRRAENDGERLRVEVMHQVAEAVRMARRAEMLLAVFEGPPAGTAPPPPAAPNEKRPADENAGMITRAETALKVAEKSYKAGASSLLELLEAQRTYLDTRAHYLRALHDFRQAVVDVTHAVGE